jgi:Ca2+-binding RTX toxin-like protein
MSTTALQTVLESLENRRLLSVTLDNGTLSVVGEKNLPNEIVVQANPDGLRIDVVVNSNPTESFDRSAVSRIVLVGGKLSDRLRINDELGVVGIESVFFGRDGDDLLLGGAENTTLFGGRGDDFLYATAGRNVFFGQDGNDTLIGGDDRDLLFGNRGDDYLYGYGGDDLLHGGFGNDGLYGGDGDDHAWGHHGDDVLEGEAGNDVLWTGAGTNAVYAGDGDDRVFAQSGTNTVHLGAGRDTVHYRPKFTTIADATDDDLLRRLGKPA